MIFVRVVGPESAPVPDCTRVLSNGSWQESIRTLNVPDFNFPLSKSPGSLTPDPALNQPHELVHAALGYLVACNLFL